MENYTIQHFKRGSPAHYAGPDFILGLPCSDGITYRKCGEVRPLAAYQTTGLRHALDGDDLA